MAVTVPPPVYLSSSPSSSRSYPHPHSYTMQRTISLRRPMSWNIPRKPLPPHAQVDEQTHAHAYRAASDMGMSFKSAQAYDHQDFRSSSGSGSSWPQARDDPSSRGSLDSINMAALGSYHSPPASPWLRATPRSRSMSRKSSTASPTESSSFSSSSRVLSWVDPLHSSFRQPGPMPPPGSMCMDNAHLRSAVGTNASLLTPKQTVDMYIANVPKTSSAAIQYEFALFLLSAMQDPTTEEPIRLLNQAKSILTRLSDRGYPFAQYYLADGYASGLFSNDGQKEDYDRAFPLFVAAGKRGHVEACYRAALCYEFGWGTRTTHSRAAQFYRQAASKNHPGAMLRMAQACLTGDMGLGQGRQRYREGIKWMKRANESSDAQYNSAPYELGLLHEDGYGDDVFPDVAYAAQLFSRSAELGHAEANYRLGDAYEHGRLCCPRDPALSIHYYTGAAMREHSMAMMALCAWYLVGAEPVLERDAGEAYEWAKRAAERDLPKAQYAVGYFTEMGIGCRPDLDSAREWYVRAADQGDERAQQRMAAFGGNSSIPERKKHERRKWLGIF